MQGRRFGSEGPLIPPGGGVSLQAEKGVLEAQVDICRRSD